MFGRGLVGFVPAKGDASEDSPAQRSHAHLQPLSTLACAATCHPWLACVRARMCVYAYTRVCVRERPYHDSGLIPGLGCPLPMWGRDWTSGYSPPPPSPYPLPSFPLPPIHGVTCQHEEDPQHQPQAGLAQLGSIGAGLGAHPLSQWEGLPPP